MEFQESQEQSRVQGRRDPAPGNGAEGESSEERHLIIEEMEIGRDAGHVGEEVLTEADRKSSIYYSYYCYYYYFVFLGPHPWHVEVPRLGVESESQLPAYARATAMPDLSRVFDLHHSSHQCRILNPLNKARDGTRNLMVPSWTHFLCATMGTPHGSYFEMWSI